MAAVKDLVELLFLVILLSEVTSTPIKGSDVTLSPLASRFLRIKTATSAHKIPSYSSNSGLHPDPNASVARFDSKLQPTTEAPIELSQITHQADDRFSSSKNKDLDKVFEPVGAQTTQHFQIPNSAPTIKAPATHSQTPSVSNFGDRIQKNGQESNSPECSVKGRCTTASFSPDSGVSFGGTTSGEGKFQGVQTQSSSDVSYDQEQQFSAAHEPERTKAFDIGQNNYDIPAENVGFPDYEGLISSQGLSEVTQNEFRSFQDGKKITDEESGKSVPDQVPVQTDFDYQMPFVTNQQDYSGYINGQSNFPVQQEVNHNDHSGFSSSPSDFPVEQSYPDRTTNFDHEKHEGTSQGFISDSQDSLNFGHQQHMTVQPNGDSHHSADDGQYYHSGNPIDWLRYSVPGNPGEDYPIFYQVPETSFSCHQQSFSAGIFGDMEASCQVFHVCKENGGHDSFLCPNGTVFNQQYFVCDWWYNFRCSDTPSFYGLNSDLYWDWDSFTPSQVLNVPSSSDDGVHSNFQGSTEAAFSSITGNQYRPTEDKNLGHSNSAKTTIVIDNSAISDNSRHIHEQKPDEHAFTDDKSVFSDARNDFQSSQQDSQGQTQDVNFKPDFTDTVHPSTVSDRNIENVKGFSTFTVNNNKQNGNNFFPVASDTGANRQQPSVDAGTRYPDQNSYGQQPIDFQSQDQSGVTQFESNQQTAYDGGRSDEGYRTVSQEHLSDSFDANRVQAFNPNQNDDVNNSPGNFASSQNQGPVEFFANGGSLDQRQLNHDVQQEFTSTPFFGTEPVIMSSRDKGYNHQTVRIDTQTQTASFDNNQQSILRDATLPDIMYTEDNHDSHGYSEIQQEQVHSSFDRNRKTSFQNENSRNFDSQNQNTVTQDDRTTQIKVDQKNDFENSGSRVSSDSQENQEFQQEHISTAFEDQNRDIFATGKIDENQKTNVPFSSGENKDTKHFPSQEQVSPEAINSFGNEGRNENQEQVNVASFDDDGSNINMEDYNNNEGFGIRQTGVAAVSQSTIADSASDNDKDNQNIDSKQDSQQEFIPAFDDINPSEPSANDRPNSERGDMGDHKQTTTSFQQSGQNAFVNEDTHQVQNIGGNDEIQQEYISNPFNEQISTDFDSNRNHNVQEEFPPNFSQGNTLVNNKGVSFENRNNVDRNNYPTTEQTHISNPFEDSRPNSHNNLHQDRQTAFLGTNHPNTFNSESTVNNFGDQDNQRVQENAFPTFGGSTQGSFIPENDKRKENRFTPVQDQRMSSFSSNAQSNFFRDQSNVSPNGQNDQKQVNIEQKNVPVENRPNTFETTKSGNHNQQSHENNPNQQIPFGVTSPNTFGVTNRINNNNAVNNPEIQQQFIHASFDGMRTNNFESSGNDGGRIMQNGFANTNQGFGINVNQQNNFRPVHNGNQQNSHVSQNLRPEQIQVSFDNNHQNKFNAQNSFGQGNHRVVQEQSQNDFRSNSFDRNAGGNQNANRAFQIRLNNFQPVDIHTMNRGGLQNGKNQQQRLSFRPYGQNDQNTVHFPGTIPIVFVQNQQNGASQAYSNDKGPSNHNFFVTNGHQVRDEQRHHTDNKPFSDERPPNDIRDDRQHGIQEFTQGRFSSGTVTDDEVRKDTERQNTNVNAEVPTFHGNGNQNINSGVKGFSTENHSRGRNIDFSTPPNAEIDPRGFSTVKTDEAATYAQPESPSSMNYNGWRPVIKY